MKIAEVSERFGISADTLRFYERSGLVQPVARDRSGIRDYGDADLMRIEFILCMRKAGLPIDVLKEYVDLVDAGEHTLGDRVQILAEQREHLLSRMRDLQQTLDLLNYKIDLYQGQMRKRVGRARRPAQAAPRAQELAYATAGQTPVARWPARKATR